MAKSVIVSILILFFISIIEVSLLSNITILPVVPDLLLIASLYFSLLNGRGAGQLYGFLSGLFIDFLTGCPLGLNCAVRLILCYVAGILGQVVHFEGIFMPCVVGFIATMLKTILTWLISLFYPSIVVNYNLFSFSFLFEVSLNTLLTPLIFKLLSLLKELLAFNPEDFA